MKGHDIGDSYLNDKKAAEFFKKNIATVSRNETVEFIDKSKYIGLTCDGTSDFIGEEYESLWIRSAQKGKITEQFLDLGSAESAASVDICEYMKCLHRIFSAWDTVIGFCSDGASNMQDKKTKVNQHL